MRTSALVAGLLLVSSLAATPETPGANDSPPAHKSSRKSLPRGPYLLRQIFGDLPQTTPTIWGVTPGMQRDQIPTATDLGGMVSSGEGPATFLKEISGRANVAFVFDGNKPDSRLDHVSVTVFQSPRITWKAVYTHLTKIYGPPGVTPPDEEGQGQWRNGSVHLTHFPSARFFEITLVELEPDP